MTTQEIANFIKTQLQIGSARPEIEKILTLNRVTPQDISAAFEIALAETKAIPQTPPPATPASSLTGINVMPKETPAAATHDRAFPPPAMAMNSVDSSIPTPPPSSPSNTQDLRPIRQAQDLRTIPPPSTPPLRSVPPPTPINVIIPTAPAPIAHKSHWFAWLLLIIILGLIGTGAYAYVAKPAWSLPFLNPILNLIQAKTEVTPTEEPLTLPIEETSAPIIDETADWKTYTNEKYGFEFKYPEELTAKIGSSTDPVNFSEDKSRALIQLAWHEITPPSERYYVSLSITKHNSNSTSTEMTNGIYDYKFSLAEIAPTEEAYAIAEKVVSTFKFIEPKATTTKTGTSTSTKDLPPVDLPSLFLPQN